VPPKLTGSGRECAMSPWIDGRGSVVELPPWSRKMSWPRVKLTMLVFSVAEEAPVIVAVTLVSLKVGSVAVEHTVSTPGVHVSMVRLTVNGAAAVVLLPLRSTSAAPPFSTTPPSGRSLLTLLAMVVQVPALAGEKDQ